MDWDKLRSFHAAAETGSFTNAGALVNLSQSAVSRQVTALEETLGGKLFHRHARGLKLTEQGELLHETVREVIARLSTTERLLQDRRNQPRGILRITSDVAFGAYWLAPRLAELHRLYPELVPVLMVDGGAADIAMGEADVALTMSVPEKPSLVRRRLLTTFGCAYAAPDYLGRHGTPAAPEDLRGHRLVAECGADGRPVSRTKWLLDLDDGMGCSAQPVAT